MIKKWLSIEENNMTDQELKDSIKEIVCDIDIKVISLMRIRSSSDREFFMMLKMLVWELDVNGFHENRFSTLLENLNDLSAIDVVGIKYLMITREESVDDMNECLERFKYKNNLLRNFKRSKEIIQYTRKNMCGKHRSIFIKTMFTLIYNLVITVMFVSDIFGSGKRAAKNHIDSLVSKEGIHVLLNGDFKILCDRVMKSGMMDEILNKE